MAGSIGALIVAVAVWNMPVSLAIVSTLNGAVSGCSHRLDRDHGGVGVQHDRESGEFEIIKDCWPGHR